MSILCACLRRSPILIRIESWKLVWKITQIRGQEGFIVQKAYSEMVFCRDLIVAPNRPLCVSVLLRQIRAFIRVEVKLAACAVGLIYQRDLIPLRADKSVLVECADISHQERCVGVGRGQALKIGVATSGRAITQLDRVLIGWQCNVARDCVAVKSLPLGRTEQE